MKERENGEQRKERKPLLWDHTDISQGIFLKVYARKTFLFLYTSTTQTFVIK